MGTERLDMRLCKWTQAQRVLFRLPAADAYDMPTVWIAALRSLWNGWPSFLTTHKRLNYNWSLMLMYCCGLSYYYDLSNTLPLTMSCTVGNTMSSPCIDPDTPAIFHQISSMNFQTQCVHKAHFDQPFLIAFTYLIYICMICEQSNGVDKKRHVYQAIHRWCIRAGIFEIYTTYHAICMTARCNHRLP